MTEPAAEPFDELVGWLSERVAEWLKLNGQDTTDAKALALVAPAVAAWVDGLPRIRRNEAGAWAKDTELGAVMLAARLVRRRNSPAGVEGFTESATVYVRRNDPDVAALLRLNAPAIG